MCQELCVNEFEYTHAFTADKYKMAAWLIPDMQNFLKCPTRNDSENGTFLNATTCPLSYVRYFENLKKVRAIA